MKIRLHTAPLLICLLAIVLICPQSSAAGTVDSLTEKSIIIHDLSTSNTRQFDDLAFPLNTDSDPIILNSPADDSIQYYRGRSQELKRVVLETQRFRETLDKMALVDLPIGIVGDKANANYAILIDKVFFNERGTFIEVYMSFEVPQMNKPLDFRGIVQITQEGGITGTARLYLLDNHEFDIGRGKLTINGDPRIRDGQNFTFVEFDCNGFKGLSLKATIEFSKDILVTETPTGEPKDERVKIALTTYLTSWSDLLLRVNIPDFQIKGVKGLGFKIDEAYFDWSDTASPPRFVAPADYQNPFVGSAQQNLWQGIYIKQAKIMFPPQFKEKGDPLRRSIGGEDLIIDQTGFSGRLFAENLIRSGDMTGWAFTLDRAEVQVVKNSLTQFAIRGRINIPAFEKSAQPADQREDASLAYSAFMTASGNYQFDVIFRERLELNLLAAELFINPNSSITIAERDQKFIASANLNGQLNINAPFSGTSALLSKISFERMIISNQAPYFRIGSVSFGSPNATENQTISGFPLTLTNIGVKSEEERVGLIVGVKVNFVKAADEGFSGSTLVTVWGKTPSTSEATGAQEQKWKFDKVEVEEVTVRMVKNGVYDLTGSVRFFKGDQLYGNGFKGFLRGSLAKINLSVQAEALFGNNTEIRYWYASALVCSGTGIPLTGFSVYGFGGGAYYQMKPAAASQNNSIGLTASGVRYEPDSKSFLGLKASVFIGTTGKPESMNGDVTLEINLNRSGGINFISFIGNIYFMTPDFSCNPRDVVGMASSMAQGKDSPPVVGSNRSQLSGHVKLLFDNVNNSFLGNVEVYVNVLGGLVQGAGPNKKAGWAELYFSPSNWHIVIGTPSSPIGLEVARLFKSQSYFMMGKNIPGSPPPPAKVSEILGLGADDLDYMRDANALQSGFGFAFGTNLTVDTGDLRFMLFYGRFTAGAGFDIMIKDYGASAHCLGVPPPLGINGWYANGQAYAFLEGKIGIKVSLPFYKGDYEILKIGAAAVLQTRAPNPFWMRGIVGGYYDILGGLVKGRCRFEVTIGKECTIVADDNALGDVTIIAEVAPVAGTKDVSVFNAAQAAFNIPVGQVFEITDNTNRTRYFRANLNELTIRQGTNAPITGTITWNATNDVAAFDAFDVLPPNVELTLRVKVTFEERINNVWTKYVLDGKTIEEVKEAAFTTGPAPDFIPPSNVAYSYPVIDQFNFYPGEYPQGYIVLKRGQPYLFTPDPTVDQKAWFKKSSGTPTQFSYQYDAGNRTVSYSLPSLELNKGYSFELVNLPKAQTAVDTNVSKVEKVTTTGEVETKVTTKDIEGTIEQGGPKVIYAAKLRTSMYNTFGDKMNAQLQTVPVIFDSPGVFQSILTGNFRLTEPFDALEIGATDLNNNLVQIEADLTNPWYESKIHPLVYEGYPLNSYMTVTNRNVTINGLPPIKSIQLNQPVPYPTLSNPTTSTTVPRLIHSTQVFAYWDFNDIIQHVANFIANGGAFTPRFRQIMIGTVANYDPGPYKVNFSYYLPGTRQKTSTRTLTMSWTLAKPK